MSAGPAGGFDLRIWGCGGSVPVGRADRLRFGGDTTCFELRRLGPDAVPLIVDLGSGARDLGAALAAEASAEGRTVRAEVVFSHFHLDHVVGMPFFAPLYDPTAEVTLRAGLVPDGRALSEVLGALAAPPLFPVRPLETGAARFEIFRPGEPFAAAGFEVTPLACTHPGGAFGFRIACPAGVVCVIGDHEHGVPKVDEGLAEAVAGADLMIYDATYETADYEAHRGWGHSTWQVGLALAEAAGVRRTLFHHHPPEMDDDALEARDADVRAASNGAGLARQGMRLRIGGGEIAEL